MIRRVERIVANVMRERAAAMSEKYGASEPGGSQEGRAGTVGNLGGILSGTSVGGLLSGGLRDLVESFKSSGKGEIADSWVRTGPNKPISSQELEGAISPEVWASGVLRESGH